MAVIVVDDGSTDGTTETAERAGASVIRHATNRGKGAALQTGFDAALARGCAAVVTIDGDGQHNIREIPKLAEAAERHGAAVVVGRRRRIRGVMPRERRMVNSSSSALLSLLTGQRLADIHSGFRFIRRDVLERVRLTTSRFDAEVGFLMDTAGKGFKIVEVPVETIYGTEESKIRAARDTLRFFTVIFRKSLRRLWA